MYNSFIELIFGARSYKDKLKRWLVVNGKFVVGGLYKAPYQEVFFITSITKDNHATGLYHRYMPSVWPKIRDRYKWKHSTVYIKKLDLDDYEPKKDIAIIINAIQSLRTVRRAHKNLKGKIIEFLLEV